jgi:NADH:ubiquinone oxidoreductase subunit 6 (subunit J)
MALRNLIHSALLLIASWAASPASTSGRGPSSSPFAQVLVYVGGVSMIVLFAVLLTRRSLESFVVRPESVGRVLAGMLTGGAVLGVLVGGVLSSPLPTASSAASPTLTVRELGRLLAGPHAAALLVVGVLADARPCSARS